MSARAIDLDSASTGLSEQLEQFVDAFGVDAGLTTEQTYWLRLAVDELVTNIAEHGYAEAGGPLSLLADHDADHAWVQIDDRAPVFDPDSVAAPVDGGWDTRPIGGFGLALVRARTDAFVHVEVDGHNRNTVTMRRGHGPTHGEATT